MRIQSTASFGASFTFPFLFTDIPTDKKERLKTTILSTIFVRVPSTWFYRRGKNTHIKDSRFSKHKSHTSAPDTQGENETRGNMSSVKEIEFQKKVNEAKERLRISRHGTTQQGNDVYDDDAFEGKPFTGTPGPHDVLLGRGGRTNFHEGNVNYRNLLSKYKLTYIDAQKTDKPEIAKEIVHLWRNLEPPGRFLIQAKSDGEPEPETTTGSSPTVKKGGFETNNWCDAGNKKARFKTSQCLRERTAQIRAAEGITALFHAGKKVPTDRKLQAIVEANSKKSSSANNVATASDTVSQQQRLPPLTRNVSASPGYPDTGRVPTAAPVSVSPSSSMGLSSAAAFPGPPQAKRQCLGLGGSHSVLSQYANATIAAGLTPSPAQEDLFRQQQLLQAAAQVKTAEAALAALESAPLPQAAILPSSFELALLQQQQQQHQAMIQATFASHLGTEANYASAFEKSQRLADLRGRIHQARGRIASAQNRILAGQQAAANIQALANEEGLLRQLLFNQNPYGNAFYPTI